MGTRARAGLVRECAPRRPVMAQGIAARPLYVHISGHANLGLCMGSHFKDDAAISQAAPIPATCADEDVHPHMEEDSTTETASTPDDTLHGDADQWLLPSQQNGVEWCASAVCGNAQDSAQSCPTQGCNSIALLCGRGGEV